MHRLASLALVAAVALASAAPAAADLSRPQIVFRDRLLEDRGTSKEIAALLRSGAGFVNRNIRFVDVTGDGRGDAIVRVSTGGAAGDVALYILSADGASDGKLRVLFRRQALYRASLSIRGAKVFYRVPTYEPGDDICCPPALAERALTWSPSTHRFAEGRPKEIKLDVGSVPAPTPPTR